MEGSGANDQPLWDILWVNVHLATIAEDKDGEGIITDGAIAVSGSTIAWVGKRKELTNHLSTYTNRIIDCEGQWLTPGLIDCHTHLVFGGHRAKEFEMALNGASYAEIARSGGGIRSTVKATRLATEEELVQSAALRLEPLLAEGVTTVEIKSGYGLAVDDELKMLRAAKKLQQLYDVTIKTTFLGAHAIPIEYENKRNDYITLVCEEMLPAVVKEGLADAVDVFCEAIGFSVDETEKIFNVAQSLGLKTKLHADQLADSGGAALAAKYHALSADHIEYASLNSIEEMSKNDTVAVLLPGAFYFLREKQTPPVSDLRAHRIPMAIATDANPGSSPTCSLLLMMNMASIFFRMTPQEVLAGVTLNAAKALGMHESIGSLEVGKKADFALWKINDLAELCYWVGVNNCSSVVKNGKCVVGY